MAEKRKISSSDIPEKKPKLNENDSISHVSSDGIYFEIKRKVYTRFFEGNSMFSQPNYVQMTEPIFLKIGCVGISSNKFNLINFVKCLLPLYFYDNFGHYIKIENDVYVTRDSSDKIFNKLLNIFPQNQTNNLFTMPTFFQLKQGNTINFTNQITNSSLPQTTNSEVIPELNEE
jgi:hypothetical protein